MSTHEQLQSENKTLHTDLQALTATISAQGARIAELDSDVNKLGRALAMELHKVKLYEKMVALICREAHITPKQLAFFAKRSQEMRDQE